MLFHIKIQLESKLHCNKYIMPDLFLNPFSRELKYKYHVTTIPHVIVVKKDGTLITNSGKTEIEEIGVNVLVTWTD